MNFCFKNLCGVMQFQLKGYGFVKSVSVKGNRGEVLAGPAVVTAGYGNDPYIAMSSEGTKEVTLDCGEGGVELNETTPVSFFIVLPPVQFEGGFTITVTDTWGGSKEYSTSKKNPVGRSKGLRMPAKEYIGVRPPQEGDYIDEYGVNHGQGIEIDGVVWAPVNCGYKAPTADSKGFPYGKLYQWGRKYGQGYDDNDESYPSGDDFVKGPIRPNAQSERSAHEFIYFLNNGQYNYPYDWANPHNDKLWNSGTESNPVKTEYDPCPAGWRVPLCSELEGLCTNYSCWTSNESGMMGYWFSGSNPYGSDILQLFLPAAGTRSGTVKNAEGKNRDVEGSYYSSRYYRKSSDGVGFLGAYYLDFDSATVSVHENRARSSGYSVRCVQE